jgi:hypothetical protein
VRRGIRWQVKASPLEVVVRLAAPVAVLESLADDEAPVLVDRDVPHPQAGAAGFAEGVVSQWMALLGAGLVVKANASPA